jgi:hypothetical protein
LGYTFSRDQILGRRLRLRHVARSERRLSGAMHGLIQVALLVVPVGLLVGLGHKHDPARQWGPGIGLLAGTSMLGYWILGCIIAGLVSAAELIRRSLQAKGPEDRGE